MTLSVTPAILQREEFGKRISCPDPSNTEVGREERLGREVSGEGDRHGKAQAEGPGGPHGRTCLACPFTAHLPGL